MDDKKTYIPDRVFAWLQSWIGKHKYPFSAVVIFGLLAHGFAFTNKLLNHDEVKRLFSKGATITSGRWGLELCSLLFPDFSMPWIYGILSIVMLAIAVCLIVDLLEIRSKSLQVLLGGLVVTFPSLTGTFCYMFTSTGYMASLLFAVGAVYLLARNNKWPGLLTALFCAVASLSIYQAYIAVTASLLVLHLIWLLINERENTKEILIRGVKYVGFLIISLALYWIATQLVLRILDAEMNSYAKTALGSSDSIPIRVCNAYTAFYKVLFKGGYGLIPAGRIRWFHLVGVAVVLVEVISRLIKMKQTGKRLLLIGLLAVFPLAINCMFFFTDKASIHTLVLYSYFCIYVLGAFLLDGQTEGVLRRVRGIGTTVATVCMALLIVSNCYLANEAYLNLHLRYENNYSMTTKMLAQIEMVPGYREDTPVLITGKYEQPSFYSKFKTVHGIMGAYGVTLDNASHSDFLTYYCARTLPEPNADQEKAIIESESFAQMPCYPDNGSVCMIDGIVVVKLSQ